jgi:hypothetical protein
LFCSGSNKRFQISIAAPTGMRTSRKLMVDSQFWVDDKSS